MDIFDIHLKTTTFEKGQYIIITGKEYDERGWWRGFSDGKVRFSKKKKTCGVNIFVFAFYIGRIFPQKICETRYIVDRD